MTTLKTTITARANEDPAEQNITQLLAQVGLRDPGRTRHYFWPDRDLPARRHHVVAGAGVFGVCFRRRYLRNHRVGARCAAGVRILALRTRVHGWEHRKWTPSCRSVGRLCAGLARTDVPLTAEMPQAD